LRGAALLNNLATQLAQADLKMTVGEFLVISFTAAIGLGLVMYILDRAILIPVGIILGFFAPRWYMSFRKGGRRKAFDGQLGEPLT
jgi:Flp pilus assembly protein TadB